VYSCDNLISLKNFSCEKKLTPGSYYLLLGWSPHIASAVVLPAPCRHLLQTVPAEGM